MIDNKKKIIIVIILVIIAITSIVFINYNITTKSNDQNNSNQTTDQDKNDNQNDDNQNDDNQDNNDDNQDNNDDNQDNNDDNQNDDNQNNNDDNQGDSNQNDNDNLDDDNQGDNNQDNNDNNQDNNDNNNDNNDNNQDNNDNNQDNNDNNNDNNDNNNNDNNQDDNDQEQPPAEKTVNNVEEMINNQSLVEGQTITTLGYYNEGIGQAIYEIVKTSNDPSKITLSNGLYAVYSDKNVTTNPMQFGAVGDGVKDDSKAIELFLNQKSTNLNLLENKYLLENSITINEQNNINIIGDNTELILDNSIININNSKGLNISNIKLTKTEGQELPININDSENIKLMNNTIQITTSNSLIKTNRSLNTTLENNTIKYINNGTEMINAFDGNSININSNNIEISSSNAINIFALDINSSIDNNTLVINSINNKVFNNVGKISNNEVTLNNKTNNIFSIENMTLSKNININDNNIINTYDETTNDQISRLIQIENNNQQNNEITIENNNVTGTNINKSSYLYVYKSLESNQQVNIQGNDIETYYTRYKSGNNDVSYIPVVTKEVSSYAKMLAETESQAGDIIKTTSFYENNNKGASYYTVVEKYPSIIYRDIETVRLANGMYAILLNTGNGISINQFGAMGDSQTDDSGAFSKAIYSGYEYIYLETGEYRMDKELTMNTRANIVLDGKDNIIYYDDNYIESYSSSHFLQIWGSTNIDLVNMNIETRMKKIMVGVTNQIVVTNSRYITITDSRLYIAPDSKETTNIDLNASWENVIVDNNEILNYCDQEAGGSIWIRDEENKESGGLVFSNNYVDKISHDEHLAVFSGTIKNIEIINNEFKSSKKNATSSVMAFSFGTAFPTEMENILFDNNTVDVIAKGALLYVKEDSDVIISNNNLTFTKELQDSNGAVINGNAKSVNNNIIHVKTPFGTGLTGQKVIEGNNVIDNEIIIDTDVRFLFYEVDNLVGNNITINGNVEQMFKRVVNANNNTITVNGNITNIIDMAWVDVTKDTTIENNTINYNYDEVANNHTSTYVYINDILLNNHNISINNNKINATNLNPNSLLYNIEINDATAQTINIKNTNFLTTQYQSTHINPNNLHNVVLN